MSTQSIPLTCGNCNHGKDGVNPCAPCAKCDGKYTATHTHDCPHCDSPYACFARNCVEPFICEECFEAEESL